MSGCQIKFTALRRGGGLESGLVADGGVLVTRMWVVLSLVLWVLVIPYEMILS